MHEILENTELLDKSVKELQQLLWKTVSSIKGLTISLPEPELDLKDMLFELLFAFEDCQQHFKRFPGDSGKHWDEQSTECHDDWTRALRRKDVAIESLRKYAELLRLKGEIIPCCERDHNKDGDCDRHPMIRTPEEMHSYLFGNTGSPKP